jgi:hypothetical protein
VVVEEHQVIQLLVIQVQQDQEVLVVVLQQLILIQAQVLQEQLIQEVVEQVKIQVE